MKILFLIALISISFKTSAESHFTYNKIGLGLGAHTGPLNTSAYTFSVKNFVFNDIHEELTVRNLGIGPMIDSSGKTYLSVTPMSAEVGGVQFGPDVNVGLNGKIKLGFSVGYVFE